MLFLSRKRISWLDASRGISILMVVFCHSFVSNLKEQYGYFLLSEILPVVFMPTMFFVSGWAFELGVKKYENNKLKSIGNKFMRLMIPYFVFSVLFYVVIFTATKIPALSSIANMGGTDFSEISLMDSVFQILFYQDSVCTSLWFLYTLFIYNVLNILFPKVMKHPVTIVILLGLPFLQSAFGDSMPDLLFRVLTYPSYFSLGRVAVHLGDKLFEKNKLRFALVTIIFTVSAIITFSLYFNGVFRGNMKYLFVTIRLILGLISLYIVRVGCSFIENTKLDKMLSYCGVNSMAIYLIHFPFITQVSSILALRILPNSLSFFACIIGTVLGVAIPLILSKYIITKVPILNTLLLGAPLKKRA